MSAVRWLLALPLRLLAFLLLILGRSGNALGHVLLDCADWIEGAQPVHTPEEQA